MEEIRIEKYPAYKDSGVEWLGEVPEHWQVLPAKRFHRVVKQPNINKQCENVLSLTLRGVVNNDLDSPEGLVPKDYGTYQIFERDNLVFKLIDLENIRTSRVGIVHEKGIMSPAYIRLVTGHNTFPKYAYYYYYSLYISEVYNKVGAGVRSTLGPNDLLALPFIKPSPNEQINISNFLDTKILQLNKSIAQKEKLIELLKERREILIHKAVTRGLNPNVPMKDSGVEWIGEIPAHWEVKKLKYILAERSERSETGEEPLLMVSQTHGLVIRSEYHAKAEVALTSVGNKVVYENDLVFNKLKAHLGVFFKSTIKSTGIVSPDYAVYYSIGSLKDMKYLEILFRHPAYIKQFICKATGIVEGLIRLYTSDLFDIAVAAPPIDDQTEILEYVNTLYTKHKRAINLQEKEIEKLKEYKETLINAAVTGNIKVC